MDDDTQPDELTALRDENMKLGDENAELRSELATKNEEILDLEARLEALGVGSKDKRNNKKREKKDKLEPRVRALEQATRSMTFQSANPAVQIFGRFPNFVVRASAAKSVQRKRSLS